jgi:hypothetical protein
VSELIIKAGQDRVVNCYGEDDTEECPPEVGVVVDIIASPSGHVHGISREKNGIDQGWHGYEVKPDLGPGSYQDESKEYGAYGAGGSQATVVEVILAFEIGRDIGGDECQEIEDQEIIVLQAQFAHIVIFQCGAEKIEGDHIEQQMHKIGVDEAAGDKTIILMPHADSRWPEDERIH